MEQPSYPVGTVLHLLMDSFLDNHRRLMQVDKELKSTRDKNAVRQLYEEFDALMFSTIIFAALILEAYINEYGARGLQVYFDRYLDRIDLLSKWVVIPRLSEGINFDQHKSLLSKISSLISARNRLVHPRLFWIPADAQQAKSKWKKARKQWAQFRSVARGSIKTIRDVAKFMDKHSKVNNWAMAIYGMTNRQIKEG